MKTICIFITLLFAHTATAATTGAIAAYNGVANRLLATNAAIISGTNMLVQGQVSANSLNATGAVTAASFTLSGVSPALVTMAVGGTITNAANDVKLTNSIPVVFNSNVVFNATVTGASGPSAYSGTSGLITNTTSESSIYTNTTLLTAGILGTNKVLYVRSVGYLENHSGGNITIRPKFYLGGSVVFDGGTYNITTQASADVKYAYQLEFEVSNMDSASAQWVSGGFNIGSAQVLTTQIFFTPLMAKIVAGGAAAIDTSAALTFGVTVTPNTASTVAWTQKHIYATVR